MNMNERCAGVLMHISALPSPYGIGNLGKEAYDFADFLSETGVKIWQMLPLNLTSYGDSPYQSPSSNGLNLYFIDLRELIKQGLLSKEECDNCDMVGYNNRVDYGKLFYNRIPLLKKAFSRFDKTNKDFLTFVKDGEYNDFSFFMTLKTIKNFSPWYQWEDKYRNYTPELEEEVKSEHSDLYLFFQWSQYEFLKEFKKLKAYINSKGIKIFGDMPLYLAYDSVEAYKYPNLFLFDEKHNPTVVAGCPPDYFSADGQLWGNPIYNWKEMKKDNYSWFSTRIEKNLKIFDLLRIDHFRGCSSYYTIPNGMKNARIGRWVKGPGIDLFKDKKDYPIIAEDLGTLDEGVYQLLRESTYPGMKVIEFGLDGNPNNEYKPTNSGYNYYCYTGTHDNMPLLGFIKSLDDHQLYLYKEDLRKECERLNVNYDDSSLFALVRTTDVLCLASPCKGAIIPIQDLLVRDADSRMNFPSTLSDKNWSYRISENDITLELKEFLKSNISKYNR